jgi:hypothetical protein
MTKLMEKAEQISKAVEACAEELLDKLCEGESKEVRDMAWTMLATRMGFSGGMGSFFVLPPLDEI